MDPENAVTPITGARRGAGLGAQPRLRRSGREPLLEKAVEGHCST